MRSPLDGTFNLVKQCPMLHMLVHTMYTHMRTLDVSDLNHIGSVVKVAPCLDGVGNREQRLAL